MKKNIFNLRLIASILAGIIIILSACDKNSDDGDQTNPTPQPEESFLRIFATRSLGEAIEQTNDGGFILTGNTSGNRHVSLIKTDINGNKLWQKTFGYEYYYGHSVQQTSDGGYIVAGYGESFMGKHRVYVVKTNASGEAAWSQTIGENSSYYSEGNSVHVTTDGGYIVTGYTEKNGDRELYILKFDADGDTTWSRIYTLDGDNSKGCCIRQTTDGGYIIGGTTGFYSYVCLLKTNANGEKIWTKTYDGYVPYFDHNTMVQQTTDGGYIIACDEVGGSAALIKTNASGDVVWTKSYAYSENFNCVQQTTDGSYIVVGSTYDFGAPGGYSDIFLMKTDATGDTLWTNHFGNIEYEHGIAVQQTTDGGYILTGFSTEDITYLIKTDINGRLDTNSVQ